MDVGGSSKVQWANNALNYSFYKLGASKNRSHIIADNENFWEFPQIHLHSCVAHLSKTNYIQGPVTDDHAAKTK